MKAKNILMTLLLVTGAIAAKAAGYPPELALVSQPVITYNNNSITVYYDVENIGDYTYRGYVSLYLDPDYGYSYADKWVKVRPGAIKRIAIDLPMRRIDRRITFTIMPYYELDDELYSFTTFEYFDPIRFYWDGPRNERWVVIKVGPCPTYYNRPGTYRFYYDGFRPPMPPHGHDHGTPPPMDPKHHTYGYHHDNGGYPATHFDGGHSPKPEAPKPETPKPNEGASVRPNSTAGSMSHTSGNHNTSSGSASGSVSHPSSHNRPSDRPSGNASRPSGSTRPSGPSSSNGSSSNVSRPSSNPSSNARPATNSSSSSTRSSGSSSSSTTRSSSSTTRSAGTTSGSSTRSSSSSRSGHR